ncbi:MAG: hypothetical protein JWO03_3958 [Bacteroidetes bacterium]|nr:hypothetical protein [Bacteroidota bacterium]
MKKVIFILAANILLASSVSAQFGNLMDKAKGAVNDATGSSASGITQGDAASAIKEALNKGIKAGVDKVSAVDGYLGNPDIKIPMPSQAQAVESGLRSIGQGALIDKTIQQINHSAEQAAPQASQIFINAISQMNINDALSIVNNKQQDAATQYLKRTTTDQLVAAFKPIIKKVLDETKTTQLWSEVMGVYNKIPFHEPANTDLPDYVTHKALDGLFYMIAKEEAKIRKDPAGQASEIIKKVFGSVKK